MITIEYLAGFVDGEGCISVTKPSPNHKNHGTIRLQLSNTNYDVLSAIQREYGGHLKVSKRQSTKHKAAWQLVWYAKEAIPLLQKLQPHLMVKQKQAILVLNEYAPLLFNRPRKRKLSEENLAKRTRVYEQMHALNQRGTYIM